MMLQCRLTGKAQEVCAVLLVKDELDYGWMKGDILQVYELVPKAYRQLFDTHVSAVC